MSEDVRILTRREGEGIRQRAEWGDIPSPTEIEELCVSLEGLRGLLREGVDRWCRTHKNNLRCKCSGCCWMRKARAALGEKP